MPENAISKQKIALLLLPSAVLLFVLSGLFFSGIIPIDEDVRMLAAAMTAFAGAADFVIALWFFRMGQSS